MRRIVYASHSNRFLAVLVLLAFSAAIAWSGLARGEERVEVDHGGLMLRGKGAVESLPAMRLGTDIAVEVTGQTARVKVTQAFRNTSDRWMEATYLYPLPDDGAVDSLKMVVGERIFVGRIKPREEARQIYEKALAEGRKAGLVEQSRPNMFRNSVANVGPGETVLVQIEFQAPVRQIGGEYALRLPLVVGPRYIPPHTLTSGKAVRDAEDVTAPTAHPTIAKGLNPVTIAVELAPGFAPAAIASPYHRIAIKRGGERASVTLADGPIPANRDFVLRWQAPGKAPAIGLFRQAFDGEHYVMATITPPSAGPVGEVPPREMVFVIDNSGSMAGDSIRAARASLLHALSTLRPQDRFNIIRFDDTMTRLHPRAVPATARNIAHARRYTEKLEAEGGTEMLPALRAALADNGGTGLRQIVFLTDGSLSNETEMMAEISTSLGRSRVFMVGIGSAPNTFLMRRMAEAGRGTFTHIGIDGEVDEAMTALLDRLSRPVVTGLTVAAVGTDLQLVPEVLPDLYAGEPLVLLGRSGKLTGELAISGMIGGKPWKTRLDLADAEPSDAVARLWGRRRVAEVEAQLWSYEIDHEQADALIEELGMAFHIVTRRTSLIAEDETPSRPAGARLTREELPLLLPAGWDFDHLFGQQQSADRPLPPSETGQDEQVDLPQGATNYLTALLQGLALVLVALLWLAGLHRRRVA